MKARQCILFVTLGLLIALHRAPAQDLTFTTNTLDAGGYPESVVAADINDDGKLDLICANYNGHSLTIFTNNGSGGAGSNATFNLPPRSRCAVVADVNGDGKLDLIHGYSLDNGSFAGVGVLTNNGSGGFVLLRSYGIGPGDTYSVAAADVNGDGKPDLIGANHDSSTLTVLTNNGSGIFGSNATFWVGSRPYCVVAADVDGNGKPDLISANDMSFNSGALSTLKVLTNNGSGGFGSNATLKAWGNLGELVYVAAADVNGDGKPDLITANYSDNSLTVFTNNGGGIFGSNATYGVSSYPRCIVVADLNGDGKSDLISANYETTNFNYGNTLTVLTNDGRSSFEFATILSVGSRPHDLKAVDVNGDGKLDLISADGYGNTLTVLINTSTFPPPALAPTLTVVCQGNGMQVAWSSDSPGWSLQQSPDLAKVNWLPSGYGGYPIADDGTNKSLTLPLPTGSLFFRLLHP